MSTIRTYADIEKLTLTSAEKKFIADCKAGKETVLGDGTLPAEANDDCEVRADLLRYLITGGCAKCKLHDWGVRLRGAFVRGKLDLSFATAKGMTRLVNCRFDAKVEALQARLEFLNLGGSHLPGLNAQGAKVTGNVFFARRFHR